MRCSYLVTAHISSLLAVAIHFWPEGMLAITQSGLHSRTPDIIHPQGLHLRIVAWCCKRFVLLSSWQAKLAAYYSSSAVLKVISTHCTKKSRMLNPNLPTVIGVHITKEDVCVILQQQQSVIIHFIAIHHQRWQSAAVFFITLKTKCTMSDERQSTEDCWIKIIHREICVEAFQAIVWDIHLVPCRSKPCLCSLGMGPAVANSSHHCSMAVNEHRLPDFVLEEGM